MPITQACINSCRDPRSWVTLDHVCAMLVTALKKFITAYQCTGTALLSKILLQVDQLNRTS